MAVMMIVAAPVSVAMAMSEAPTATLAMVKVMPMTSGAGGFERERRRVALLDSSNDVLHTARRGREHGDSGFAQGTPGATTHSGTHNDCDILRPQHVDMVARPHALVAGRITDRFCLIVLGVHD
jgi:hypothetical protein